MNDSPNNKLWYLKNLDLFKGIPEEEIMKLAERVEECSYNKDDMIYSPHDELNKIYVLKRGEVRLFHSINGKRIVFEVLGAGSIFGGIDFSNAKSSHFAQATHPSRVCIFNEEDFTNILRAKPEIMLKFIKKMTSKVHDLEERLKNRNYQAEELIYLELERLQEKRQQSLFGRFINKSNIHITHEELAELTGLNRVTVTRSIKRLKESGRISADKAGIQLM